jgi:hypothetical protein
VIANPASFLVAATRAIGAATDAIFNGELMAIPTGLGIGAATAEIIKGERIYSGCPAAAFAACVAWALVLPRLRSSKVSSYREGCPAAAFATCVAWALVPPRLHCSIE